MELKGKAKIKGVHTFIITDKNGKEKQRIVKENIVVAEGRNAVCQILAGKVSTEGINYCALGTGTTAITDDDTQLENEGSRMIRGASTIDPDNDAFIVSFYFNQSEGNGTWTRYATFIDGTAAENSGFMFSHLAEAITKASGEGLTINSQYTLYDGS